MKKTWIQEDKFYLIVILLLLLIMSLRTPLDSDMWWHLRAGEQTWLDRQVYAVDTFSFTRFGQSWLNHSWLSQVIMFGIFEISSFLGLSVWVALSAVLSLMLIYFQMDGHPLFRGAVLILAGAVAGVVWSPRPQLMSLVMFGLVSYLLYLYKWKNRDYLVWLLPIFVLWGNLHGGYVLGVMLLGVMIAGEILNKILPGTSEMDLDWVKIRKLVFWSGACMLAVLINPFGLGMWKIPFNTVGVEALQNLISEWSSPDFHQLYQQPLLWMLFLGIFAIGTSGRRSDASDLVALIFFSWLALTARRNFGPFAMVAAPIITRHLSASWAQWSLSSDGLIRKISESVNLSSQSAKSISPMARNAINISVIFILSMVGVWKAYQVSNQDFMDQAIRAVYPVEAVEILSSEQPGNIFNEYDWGGYLIWNLRDHRVFVDGRTDLYGDEIIGEWVELVNAKSDWRTRLNYYQTSYILLNSNRPINPLISVNSEIIITNENFILMKWEND